MIEVRPISTNHERQIFLTFPWKIYRGDRLWVPPLLPERKKLITPKTSSFFSHGTAEFFIAWRDGEPVGTIGAAVDVEQNEGRSQKNCVIGFFEAIDDDAVARALFDKARDWAQYHGLDCLYGPFNLDYEAAYGVLIEGRDRPAALLCGHTPPYYERFFDQYGFQPARGDNLAYAVSLADSPQIQQLARLADRVRQTRQFSVRTARMDSWEEEIDVVHPMINAALSHLPDPRPWPREELHNLFGPFLQIADPELVLFAEENGKAIGFFPGVPNINEALIHANGLRYPWDYLTLWWYSRRQPECLSIKSVLVYPEFWGSGVAILLFDEMARRARAKGYRWVDLSLTSADNPRTPMLAERFGGQVYKRYRVYRKWL